MYLTIHEKNCLIYFYGFVKLFKNTLTSIDVNNLREFTTTTNDKS